MYMLLKDHKILHDVRGWIVVSEDTFLMIWNMQTTELEFRNFLLFFLAMQELSDWYTNQSAYADCPV